MVAANTLQLRPPLPFPWAEFIGKNEGYSQGYRFQTDQTQATMKIMVYWEDFVNIDGIFGAVPAILGYAQRAGIGRITRVPPMKHPYFPWLYASAITDVQGIKPNGTIEVTTNVMEPNYTAAISKYKFAVLTVAFSSLPYAVMSNQQLAQPPFNGSEIYRNVAKYTDTNANYISVNAGTFKFVSGPQGAPQGTVFPLGTGKIQVKVDLRWIWHDVPEQSLFGPPPNNFIPTNIYACLGTVNAAPIWGFSTYELLMLPPKITPVIQPISPALMLFTDGVSPPRSYNVELLFQFFRPTLGPNTTDGGHQAAFYVRDGLYYLIRSTLNSGTTGGFLFQSTDFNQVFQSL